MNLLGGTKQLAHERSAGRRTNGEGTYSTLKGNIGIKQQITNSNRLLENQKVVRAEDLQLNRFEALKNAQEAAKLPLRRSSKLRTTQETMFLLGSEAKSMIDNSVSSAGSPAWLSTNKTCWILKLNVKPTPFMSIVTS